MKLSILYEDINSQTIYDFYAILGSGVDPNLFGDFLRPIANEVLEAIRKQVVIRFHNPYLSPYAWKEAEAEPKLQKVYHDMGDFEPDKSKYFVQPSDDIDTTDLSGEWYERLRDAGISFERIMRSLFLSQKLAREKLNRIDFAGETWKSLYEASKEDHKDLKSKLIQIDTIFGLSHHGGSILDYIIEVPKDYDAKIHGRSIVNAMQALNAKYNAKNPSEYWDKVSSSIRRRINHARRENSLPFITFDKNRATDIFYDSHHVDSNTYLNIEMEETFDIIRSISNEFYFAGQLMEGLVNSLIEKGYSRFKAMDSAKKRIENLKDVHDKIEAEKGKKAATDYVDKYLSDLLDKLS